MLQFYVPEVKGVEQVTIATITNSRLFSPDCSRFEF